MSIKVVKTAEVESLLDKESPANQLPIADSNFDWVMESAVYSVKNSLALLQCLLEQQSPGATANGSDDFATEQVNVIQRETSRIDNDTTQLLALYRMHKQQLSLRVEEVELRGFLEEAVIANELLFKSSHLSIALECDDDVIGFFDPILIRSVIHSAIVGAVKYAKSALTIAARYQDEAVIISIKDDGAGFPVSLLQQYGKLESAHPGDEHIRTQMNFYFASCVAQQHSNDGQKGYIQLSNQADSGGLFEIYLP